MIPRHGHLFRQLDVRSVLLGSLQPFVRPSEAWNTVISTQKLLYTVNHFPDLYSCIIPAGFDCDCDFKQILELRTGKITQLGADLRSEDPSFALLSRQSSSVLRL